MRERRTHLSHFSWSLQIPSILFCQAEVWGGPEQFSIHLPFLSEQLLTFFQSLSLMILNLVPCMFLCLISGFLIGTSFYSFSSVNLALLFIGAAFIFFLIADCNNFPFWKQKYSLILLWQAAMLYSSYRQSQFFIYRHIFLFSQASSFSYTLQ